MANTAQAKKRARQAEAHRQLNTAQRSALRTEVKKAAKAAGAGDKAAAQAAYRDATAALDRSARKGLIHRNTAARQKSRLNARLRAASAA